MKPVEAKYMQELAMRDNSKRLKVMEAFRYFGTKPTNRNWSWSGSSDEDGSPAVTVSVWQHELQMSKGWLTYNGSLDDARLGARELKRNLQLALRRCGGRVSVIILVARDTRAKRLTVLQRFPASFNMLVKQLDLKVGTFSLQIERDDIRAAA